MPGPLRELPCDHARLVPDRDSAVPQIVRVVVRDARRDHRTRAVQAPASSRGGPAAESREREGGVAERRDSRHHPDTTGTTSTAYTAATTRLVKCPWLRSGRWRTTRASTRVSRLRSRSSAA